MKKSEVESITCTTPGKRKRKKKLTLRGITFPLGFYQPIKRTPFNSPCRFPKSSWS